MAALWTRHLGRWGQISTYRAFITLSCLLYLAVLSCVKIGYLALLIKITLPIGVLLLIWSLMTGRIEIDYLSLILFLIVIPLSLKILFVPIDTWDGRSIWFFHAKMIYYQGQFSAESGLTEPAVNFSHLDYPKLNACLAAVSSSLAGYWNEFVPKGSLLVFLVGLILGTARLDSFGRLPRVLFVVAIGPLGVCHLRNSMMDGWLASYCLLGQAFLIDYLYRNDIESLKAGIMTILLLALIKNEGMVLAFLSLFVFTLFYLLVLRKSKAVRISLRQCLSVGTFVVMADFLVLKLYNYFWDLSTQYRIDNLEWVKRAAARLNLSDLKNIYLYLIHKPGIDWLVLLLTIILIFRSRLERTRKAPAAPELLLHIYFPMITAALYLIVLFTVYLSTIFELSWHLTTSLPRVALPVILLVVLSLHGFYCLFPARADYGMLEGIVCRLIELGSKCRTRNEKNA